jgi:hypothetical protein
MEVPAVNPVHNQRERTVDHDWAADDGTNAKSTRGQRNDWLMLAP